MAVSYKTAEAKKYQKEFSDYVKKEAENQGWIKSENKFQHYYMDCYFYFPRIDMDANNYIKVEADSITDSGVVWIDDTQLCERIQKIQYDSENPRLEVVIYPVDYIGIFENMSQFEEFKSNCIQCLKYKQGKCSLFNDAISGRVRIEIQNNKCLKEKVNV